MTTLLFSLLIGVFAGLRSLTAPATTAWAAYQGWLRLNGPLALIGTLPSLIIFTILAVLEIIADKHPKTPSRTALPGLSARILMGALAGACIANAGEQNALLGALAGAIGGVLGCFGGYYARKYLVTSLKVPDFVVAIAEDLIAIAGCFWVVMQF